MRFVSDFDKEFFIMHCSVIFNAYTYTSILTTLYNPFIFLLKMQETGSIPRNSVYEFSVNHSTMHLYHT